MSAFFQDLAGAIFVAFLVGLAIGFAIGMHAIKKAK